MIRRPLLVVSTATAIAVLVLFGLAPRTVPLLAQGQRAAGAASPVNAFNRIATFDAKGEAEIVAATPDGRTLVYTDPVAREVGFVDITTPGAPAGRLAISTSTVGVPTSVAVTSDGQWALVAIYEGSLLVVEVANGTVERTIDLGGQPDSVTVSGDGRYAAVAIENERANDGPMPDGAPGNLTIIDLVGPPSAWTSRTVSLTGLADRFSTDPEPEFVDINDANEVAITLQENNHVVIVDLESGSVVAHWSAGTTTHAADVKRDGEIALVDEIVNARREPDAIRWTADGRLITANEGDYSNDLARIGGRDFTLFSRTGEVLYEPGVAYEFEAVRHGHYPDARSGSKGTEPEGAAVAMFGNREFVFVGSERGNFLTVYRRTGDTNFEFVQVLPTGRGPEGVIAIPSRNLLVTADEANGTLSIFEGINDRGRATYPTVYSDDIPWSALSGLDASGDVLVTVPDSAFAPSRIWTLELGRRAMVSGVTVLTEAVTGAPLAFDLEGIAVRPQGGFWLVSEGAGNAPTASSPNRLLRVDDDGRVVETVTLPPSVNSNQRQFGFEGVTTSPDGAYVYVAFQREWADDPTGVVKIGRYEPSTGAWRFFRYPLDTLANPPSGAWVGLSEISRIDDTTFLIVERDNQERELAQVKRLYRFSIAGLDPVPAGQTPPTGDKSLVRDLLATDHFRLEKLEGAAVLANGDVVVVNDNDGVGETRLLRFPKLLR